MANFDRPAPWQQTIKNPASPEGLRQTAAKGFAAEQEGLKPWFGTSYLGAAQDWYGGRNILGENNGWSNDFMSRSFDYVRATEQRAGETKNPTVVWDMFDSSIEGNEKATGVATWDDDKGRWKRGDVFVDGRKDSNLYEDMDKGTADTLVLDFMDFTADQKRNLFKESDPAAAIGRAVEQKSKDLSDTASKSRGAYQFETEVNERQEDLGGATGALGSIAAGAGGGALLGSAFGPIGTVVGTVVGGVGGWLNQDQLSEQVARSMEISERAFAKYDPIRGSLHSAKEWAGTGMRVISPFSNVWQGSADALMEGGSVGDGRSEFYEVNADGSRKASALIQGGDIVATLADSVLQFGGVGKYAYMGLMGTSGATGLAGNLSAGAMFNMRTGEFDPFESGSEWFAGIASPVIDVVQMGTAGAVTRAATRNLRTADELGDAARATYNTEMGAMRFTRDKVTGEVVEYKGFTLGALAPSESLFQVPIRWKARTIAMKAGRTEVTGDDLFRAAQMVTAPQSQWRSALVNGLAEGYEEAWQGFLDPMAVGENVNGTEVFVQALYGAAGGVGMSAGALLQRSGPNGPRAYQSMPLAQVELEARLKHSWRTNEVMTDDEWKAFRATLSDEDLRRMAVSDAEEARQIGSVVRTITDQLTIDNTRASVLGDAFARAVTELRDSGLRNVNPNAEEQLSILAFENDEFVTSRGLERVNRANTAMMSSRQMVTVLYKRLIAARLHVDELTEQADKIEAFSRVTVLEELHGRMAAYQRQLAETASIDEAKQIVARMNSLLQQAYDGEMRTKQVDDQGNETWVLRDEEEQAYWRKASTIVFGRHPFIDSGSFAGFMPQVSFAMTLDNAHAAIGIHQGFLKPLQADSDGDRTTTLNLVYLPDDKIANLRRGLQQFQPTAEGEGSKLTHNIDMPDGENVRMLVWTEELNKPSHTPEHQAVWNALADVEKWVIDRFADRKMSRQAAPGAQGFVYTPGGPAKGPLPWNRAVALAKDFRDQFAAGDKDAMQNLRDALLNEVGADVLGEMSTKEPVLLELQQKFTTRFLKAGRELARLRMTSATPTVVLDQQRPDDITNQQAISRGRSATVSQTLGSMGSGDPTRDSQKLWFSDITRVLADVRDNGWTPQSIQYMARLFRQQTQGDSRTEAEVFLDKDPVQGRVLAWLDGIVRDIDRSANPAFAGTPTHELRAVLMMMRVPSVKMIDGEAVADGESSISLGQYLLRKSIEVETDVLRNVPEDDPRWRKLNTLRSMTYDNGPHSYTPKTAAVEMLRYLPAEQVVGVGDADYLGSNTTLDQKIKELSGLHPVTRKDALHKLKRSPAYMTEEHRGLGDPPYTLDQMLDENGQLRVNAYTLMVDALETAVNKLPDQYVARDKRMGEQFRKGLGDLHNYIDNLRSELLKQKGVKKEWSDRELLEMLIRQSPELADMIVSLIPEAALSGVMSVEDTQVYAAPWLMNVLLERNVKRAEKSYFVYKHLSAFNQAGAAVDTDSFDENLSREERQRKIAESAPEVDFDKLKSRFEQTLFIAAEDPTGFLLGYMLQQMDAAESVEDLLAAVNKVPALLGDRAPLLAYLDDVAQFESSPQDLWSLGLTSTQMLEALDRWSSRIKQMSDAALDAWAQEAADKILLQDARTQLESNNKTKTRDSERTIALIRQARENRIKRPDSVGPTARSAFLRVCWDPFVPMQDKGAAPEVAQFIEAVLTSYNFGVKQGWEQALDGVTAYQWKDIATNVTLLLEGPAQIMLPDGRTMLLDLSDDLTVVKMLQDPATRPFMKAVLFDTVRDVDRNNSLQHYANTTTNGSIGQLLQEQDNVDLLMMTDRNPRSRQLKAHRGIGLVESALIKKAASGAVTDQGAALLPITRAIGEVLVAYTSRGDLDGVNRDMLQRNATEESWALLVALASKSKEERTYLRRSLTKTFRKRVGGESVLTELKEMFDNNPLLQGQFEQLLDDMVSQLRQKADELVQEARGYEQRMRALPPGPQRTPDQAKQWTMLDKLFKQASEESSRLMEQAKAVKAGNLHLVDDSMFSADVAKAKYQMLDENEPGISQKEQDRRRQANTATRLNIRNLLEQGNNKEAFRGKGTPLELLEKLALIDNTTLHRLDDPKLFTAKDWEQLGLWAATIHFTQLTERSADQSLKALGTAEVDRLYDRTFQYPLDVFFNDAVLDEVRALMNPSLAALPSVPLEEIEALVTGKLLSRERLGKWNSALVTESLKVREMITRGPVGLAVAAAGNNAKRQRSQVGTATATTTAPDPVAHMRDLTFDPENPNPAEMDLILNGFFTGMTLVNKTQGTTTDITSRVGVTSARPGMDDKFKILRKRNYDRALEQLRSNGTVLPGDQYEITITFVDPDTKPFTPEYVNSVYFDKAGRNEEFMPLDDVISGSIFSTGGWSKDSQQRVFDVAARGGSAGFPTPLIPQSELAKLNRDPSKAGDFIRRAARLIMTKQYNDMEKMLDVDQAAVIKLLKQRMVAVGTVDGVQRIHWIDEVISRGPDALFDPGTAMIVELSEEVASTLLSEQGMNLKPGVVASTEVNPNKIDISASLDPDRLEKLGITGIGETIEWNDPNSPLRSFNPLRTASMSQNRGEAYMRTYRQRMERWQAQASRVHQEVPAADQQAWRELNTTRMDELKNALGQDLLLQTFTSMGIPEASYNAADPATNLLIRSQLDKFFGSEMSGRRVYKYTTRAGDKNVGILSKVEIENDFEQAGTRPPVYGDFVVINLDEFVTGPMTKADYDRAAAKVMEVMEAFGHRGVRIFLTSSTTSYQVKERIAVWMQSDPMGYEPVHDSTSVYVPVTEFGSEGRTARAMRRSLTEVDVFNPRHVAGRLLSDELFPLLGANENVVLVDTEYDGSAPWQRMAQLLVPGDLTIANQRGAISLNYPTPQQMVLLQKMLLPMVENDATWQDMLKQTNDKKDPKKADPKNVQTYKQEQFAGDRSLLTPGILDAEAARQRLISMLKSGVMPGVGDEVLPGQFLPILNVSRDGTYSVQLTRVGFKLPDEEDIRRNWEAPLQPGNPMRVSMPTNKPNDVQTVPPPMMITQEPINTAHGLMVVGEFEHHKWGKWIDAALGFKAGRIKLSSLRFRGPMSANGWRPSEVGSLTSESGKQTTGRTVNNFRDLFTVTGFDIRNLMVDAFVGKQADQAAYDTEWFKLKVLLDKWAAHDFGYTEDAIYRAMTTDGLITAWQEFSSFLSTMGAPALKNPLREDFMDDPTRRIATMAMMTLMAPRMRVEHVVSSPGMLSVKDRNSETLQIKTLPHIFTKALQTGVTPETTKYLIGIANASIAPNANGEREYWFDTNFKFHSKMDHVRPDGTTGTIDVVSWFQLVKPSPATEDLNAYADANTKSRKDESLHIAGIVNSALGGDVMLQRDFEEKFRRMVDSEKIVRFGPSTGKGVKGDLWDMLTRIQKREDQGERLAPLQWKYLVDSIEDVRGYCMAFDKSGWDADIDRVREVQAELLRTLGLTKHLENERVEVDYLVRQFYGSPGARAGQKNFVEVVSAQDYVEAVRMMTKFAKDNRNPLEAAKVPYPHEALWRKIHEAGVWKPRLGSGKPTRVADTWDEAVYALFGQIEQSKQTVDTRFRRPMDGFMRTYAGTLPELRNVAVSGDDKLNQRLLDPEVNRHFISMDPGVSELLENPVILAEMEKTITNMMGLTHDVDPNEAAFMDSSALIAHRERVDRWAKRQDLTPQVKTSYLEYLDSGTEYIGKTGSTHALMTGLVNLSLINRLLNPPLFVSAIGEVWSRTALESFTDLILGDQIRGGGIVANKLSDQLEKRTDGKVRWQPRYNEQEIRSLRSLARQMAGNTDFMEYLYKELMYTHMVTPGRGAIGNFLEKGATKVARAFSDPRWGMPAQSVTELYIGSVLEHMLSNGAIFTVESFVQQMEQDPLFLVKQSREEGGFSAHKAGLNRVAQIRSMKPTVLGKAFTGPIDTLTHGNAGYNFLGHLLKIPFQFAGFTSNAFITMAGLGGADQIIAMFLDGREKPGFINRMDAHIRGQKPQKDTFDMSDVLEAVDLSRAFIRGGVTQTGLFAAALFASNLGLGGEDDEMRKRRKLAEYLNTPLFLDPREMQNDFLYADAIFVDQIPILGTLFKDTDMPEGEERSVIVPHWIIRQFTSPMMGTLRFLQTGDAMDIYRGFADAFSVMPNSVLRLWDEASETATLLFAQADEEDYEGNTAEAQSSVTKLLINAISMYEKALIENSFINGLRNGADEYNRNPWLMPATDETGNIAMREGRNDMPLRSKALESYRDPETGEVREAYDVRTGMSGQAHAYAENNLTFSLLASLFTGQVTSESSYLRNNMVVGETKITLPEVDRARIEATLLSAFEGQGGQQMLTFDEAVRKVKKKYEDANVRWNQTDVEEEARILVDAIDKEGHLGGMSVISPEGAELITKEGAKGVYHSLRKGALDFSDGALAGLWIDMDTRKAIEAEWAEDLIQEGVDLGLNQQTAEYRMKRIMRGDFNDPERPGLRAILYSDKIPYSGDVRYNQLNMTYMIGPDGKPWATPFKRQSPLAALGIPVPQTVQAAPAGMRKDSRGKLVDEVYGINLGVHGLERQLEEPPEMPDESALDAAAAKTYTPQQSGSYGAFKRWPRRSYGGGGGSSYGPNFQRMQPLPQSRFTLRQDDIPFINTLNPQIRRARIHRERITSERGRLKQWQ